MSQPPYPYNRIFDFESFSIVNPTTQQPGVQIEGELDAIKRTLDSTMSRLSEIQRDDGYIRDSALDESTIIPYFYSQLYALFQPVFLEKAGGEMNVESVVYWAQNTLSPVEVNGEQDTVTTSMSLGGVIVEENKFTDAGPAYFWDWPGGQFTDVRTSTIGRGSIELTHKCIGLWPDNPTALTNMGRLTMSAGKSVNGGVFPVFDGIDTQPHIQMWDQTYGTITIKPYGITFKDGTEQTTRGLSVAEVQYEAQSAANAAISNLVGGAPAFLDTLSEIADAINNDADIANTLNTSISAKLDITTAASTYYPLTNPDGYITSGALSSYLTVSAADAVYYPLTNPSGYITTASLSGYLTSATAATTYFPIPTGDTTQYIAGDGTLQPFPTLATANKLTAVVYNQTGVPLTKGTVVYINGAHGTMPTVAKSQANAESTSAGTYGFVVADIPNAASGTVIIAGVAENLNTSGYVDGNILYLSPTVAGGWTTTKPVAPNHIVYLGVVTRAHPTLGTVQLRIANGFELDEIHDVLLTSKTNNDLLAYESSTGLWKNKSYATLGLQTVSGMSAYLQSSTAASTYYPLTNPSGYITSASLTGFANKFGYEAITVVGEVIKSMDSSDNFVQLNQTTLQFGNGSTVSGLSVNGSQITFADATVQTTAGIGDAPFDSLTYGRVNGSWAVVGSGGGSGTLTISSGQLYDSSTANYVSDLSMSGTMSAGTVTGGNATIDTSGLTLTYGSAATITFPDGSTQSTAASGGGGGGGVDIQIFGSPTTSGTFTWTKPAGAKVVEVFMWGAGGSGASGARQPTTAARSGSGGGSGGTFFNGRIHASYLGATETVVVGAGVAGGTPQTVNGSSGRTPASTPTASTFSIFKAPAGNNGSLPSAGGSRTSVLGISSLNVGAGGSGTSTTGSSANTISLFNLIATGGGGGAGAAASSTAASQGGTGGSMTTISTAAGIISMVAGGSGGWLGTPASAGSSATAEMFRGGTGGGGGGYLTNTTGLPAGNGGWPGGGGGGGGASDNGFESGAGGAGANGYVVIITYT